MPKLSVNVKERICCLLVWVLAISLQIFIITLKNWATGNVQPRVSNCKLTLIMVVAGIIGPKRCCCGCVEMLINTEVGHTHRGNDMSYPVGGVSPQGICIASTRMPVVLKTSQ